jgi:hypothetical protein
LVAEALALRLHRWLPRGRRDVHGPLSELRGASYRQGGRGHEAIVAPGSKAPAATDEWLNRVRRIQRVVSHDRSDWV